MKSAYKLLHSVKIEGMTTQVHTKFISRLALEGSLEITGSSNSKGEGLLVEGAE